MKRLLVLVALVVLVAVAASTALGRNARPAATAACAKGAVAARIGGKSVCLRVGMACKARYKSSYKKHRFTCIAGHLRETSDGETTHTHAHPHPDTRPSVHAADRAGRHSQHNRHRRPVRSEQ